MSRGSIRIHLSPDEEPLYSRLLMRETPAILSPEHVLRMGLEHLLGKQVSEIRFDSSPVEQLGIQRFRLEDLEKRLAEKSSQLDEVTAMLREYQRDMATVESVMPTLERQTLTLKQALGLKIKTPPRFIREEDL
ncbi:MAG: hypothetical protein ACUVT7_04470 [Thermoplasmata archaeon]